MLTVKLLRKFVMNVRVLGESLVDLVYLSMMTVELFETLKAIYQSTYF